MMGMQAIVDCLISNGAVQPFFQIYVNCGYNFYTVIGKIKDSLDKGEAIVKKPAIGVIAYLLAHIYYGQEGKRIGKPNF
jgi:hypothetical protein